MNAYRVLVTGSRTWTDPWHVRNALFDTYTQRNGRSMVVVHGAAQAGADHWAAEWVRHYRRLGFDVTDEPHPAPWHHGRGSGPTRNTAMVKLGADVCLAFIRPCTKRGCNPRPHGSHGTTDCAAKAEAAGIPTVRHHWEEP